MEILIVVGTLLVCFALGVVALILCVFQAWSGKIGSASALGAAFVICGVFLFLSQIKTFKVWEVQVELRETLDRAEEIIGRVRKLAAISARASYLTIAWGNRLGTPPAREKQAVLDEIDNQLAELKVSPEELADIQRPFVKMVRWSRLSEQIFRVNKWRPAEVKLPGGMAAKRSRLDRVSFRQGSNAEAGHCRNRGNGRSKRGPR